MHMLQLPWLTTDFDKWKDEDDEEDEAPNADLGGMGGMPGMGGMDMQSVSRYVQCSS